MVTGQIAADASTASSRHHRPERAPRTSGRRKGRRRRRVGRQRVVFPSRVGTPLEPDNLRHSWYRIRQVVEGRVRFNDLRHTPNLAAAICAPPGLARVRATIYGDVSTPSATRPRVASSSATRAVPIASSRTGPPLRQSGEEVHRPCGIGV